MTPEEQARFEALERRVEELERRLAPRQKAIRTLAAAQPRAPGTASAHRELNFGLNWISRIAVVTVVLALAFFFEYAFENRWITESGRVLLGLACGGGGVRRGRVFLPARTARLRPGAGRRGRGLLLSFSLGSVQSLSPGAASWPHCSDGR